jgi:hypothetical protein
MKFLWTKDTWKIKLKFNTIYNYSKKYLHMNLIRYIKYAFQKVQNDHERSQRPK